MRILILGVGNPIIPDDSIGLHIADMLKTLINDPCISIEKAYTSGFSLVDQMLGYDKVIVIDALYDESGVLHDVKRYRLEDISYNHAFNPHDVSLPEAFRLAKSIGYKGLPGEVIVIGIVTNRMPSGFDDRVNSVPSSVIPKVLRVINTELGYMRMEDAV